MEIKDSILKGKKCVFIVNRNAHLAKIVLKLLFDLGYVWNVTDSSYVFYDFNNVYAFHLGYYTNENGLEKLTYSTDDSEIFGHSFRVYKGQDLINLLKHFRIKYKEPKWKNIKWE